ncbi:hypothetical protein TIFTF001_005860 [Ficus carica]|uniref:Uncharacterized protein n=1 Tax=Ficus carica TaxID=3494 RepID=A0AA87ZZ83_FICCA|nr:hypothetical protein TIFTF001_005860 [Ficus carica]
MDNTKFYTCSKTPCSKIVSFGFASLVENSICACGKAMDNMWRMNFADGKVDRGFITRAQRFMVTDDFQVFPESISYAHPLLLRHGINDNSGVEEWKINVGLEEVLQLLHRSMLSKTPLTDVFLQKDMSTNIIPSPNLILTPWHCQMISHSSTDEMNVKLWFSKSTNRVICIEAKEDFVDFLFSFLTIPVGSIRRLLWGNSCMGSIDNLYEKDLAQTVSEAHNHEPQMAWHNNKRWWFHKRQGPFLVTDNLTIETLSTISGLSRLDKPLEDLEELSVTVGKEEALALLRAALTSKSVLTHAFRSHVLRKFFYSSLF